MGEQFQIHKDDVHKAVLREGERDLFIFGDYYPLPISGKYQPIFDILTKAFAWLGLIVGILAGQSEYYWVSISALSGSAILLFWEKLYGLFHKSWAFDIIITDQRVILPSQYIDGPEISHLERGFGLNGAVLFEIVKKSGQRIALPIINIHKVKDLIEHYHLGGAKPS